MPTFYHGSKARLYLNGRDFSNYTKNIQGAMSIDTSDVSTLGERAKKYITGLQDSTLTVDGIFDGAASRADAIINEALSSGSSIVTWPVVSDAIGSVAYGMQFANNTYDVESGMGDAAMFSMAGQSYSDGGLERCLILWAGSTITANTCGTGVSYSPSNPNGGALYLHALSLSGSLRVLLQVSGSDVDAAYTTVLSTSFPATACYTAQRLTASGNLGTYMRICASPAGTGSYGFHAAFGKYYTAS